jgi:branched-subunit amino acid ABC-type transport system permease component
MEVLSFIFSLLYQYADSAAVLLLSSVGLIIIFGMMGVINMAHGELMMIGAYVTAWSYHGGISTGLAIILGGIAAGCAGVLIERLIVRRFYGQLLASLVATWGLSLVVSQAFLLLFGPGPKGVPTPFGSFTIGELSYSYYRLVMFAAALVLILGVWVLFAYTRFGTQARATMENPEVARALGTNTSAIYALTFGLGSMLAGLAGAMLALTALVEPNFGQSYTVLAFITVVVGGGADFVSGLLSSALILAGVKTIVINQVNILLGQVAMMATALVIIRVLPTGLSGYFERMRLSVGRH